MKKIIIGALIASQIGLAAQPAFAADLTNDRSSMAQRQGAFAGARLRVPLGGDNSSKVRAGLTIAPLVQGRSSSGEIRTRLGEGLEFGIAGQARKPGLSIAGTPVSQLAQGKAGPTGARKGVSTLGWVAIGVGVVLVSLVAITAACVSDTDCIPSE
jgi:hypothetical protein